MQNLAPTWQLSDKAQMQSHTRMHEPILVHIYDTCKHDVRVDSFS